MLGACDLFTGKERTLDEVVRLFLSPQGMEFCLKHGYPNLNTFRQLKAYDLSQYGIYVDAGNITLRNPQVAVIVGSTTASVICDTLECHSIYLLHRARAVVNAFQWSVVKIQATADCDVMTHASNNSVIL